MIGMGMVVSDLVFGYYDRSKISKSGNHTHANVGSNWGHNNQLPYYVLTYIMKL
jgi:microcystin-dependent protein